MTFAEAVDLTSSIRGHLKAGLKALKSSDKDRVSGSGRLLSGSVDIDAALRDEFPNAARWDYGIGIKAHSDDFVAWLEVHPASSHHVDEVISKLLWLKGWLQTCAVELDRLPRRFYWVATGAVSFDRASPQAKRIAQAGLRFPAKHINLDALV